MKRYGWNGQSSQSVMGELPLNTRVKPNYGHGCFSNTLTGAYSAGGTVVQIHHPGDRPPKAYYGQMSQPDWANAYAYRIAWDGENDSFWYELEDLIV